MTMKSTAEPADVSDKEAALESDREDVPLGLDVLEQCPMHRVKLDDLRPTQLAVGMQQVREKEAKIQGKRLAERPKKAEKFLQDVWRRIPAIRGPTSVPGQSAFYIVDHHHLALALIHCGIQEAYVAEVEDCSSLSLEQFWQHMQASQRVWGFDAQGNPLSLEQFVAALPTSLKDLRDDPHRSLAALVRKSGGYQKSRVPYSEFQWANFLRQHVKVPDCCQDMHLVRAHLPAALQVAASISEQEAKALKLPGK